MGAIEVWGSAGVDSEFSKGLVNAIKAKYPIPQADAISMQGCVVSWTVIGHGEQ